MIKKTLARKKKLTINSIVSRKPRKAAFLREDAEYLDNNSGFLLGRCIGEGCSGTIFEVQDKTDFVIKAPNAYGKKQCMMRDDKFNGGTCAYKDNIEVEARVYDRLNLKENSLAIPTKRTPLGKCNRINGECTGLIRPKVDVVTDPFGSYSDITRSQIEQLRRKVIAMSHDGLVLTDGLQVGLDKAGRMLQFDLEDIEKGSPERAFRRNNTAWTSFLHKITGIRKENVSAWNRMLAQYGIINPNERY